MVTYTAATDLSLSTPGFRFSILQGRATAPMGVTRDKQRSRKAVFGYYPDEEAIHSKKYSEKGQWKVIFTSFCNRRLKKQF